MISSTNEQDNQASIELDPTGIRHDPVVVSLIRHLPVDISQSYTDRQLIGIKMMLGDRVWNRHYIDRRGTFSLPFFIWRFYYVIILSKNKRAYNRREKGVSLLLFLGATLCGIALSTLLGMAILYLFKTVWGLDIF